VGWLAAVPACAAARACRTAGASAAPRLGQRRAGDLTTTPKPPHQGTSCCAARSPCVWRSFCGVRVALGTGYDPCEGNWRRHLPPRIPNRPVSQLLHRSRGGSPSHASRLRRPQVITLSTSRVDASTESLDPGRPLRIATPEAAHDNEFDCRDRFCRDRLNHRHSPPPQHRPPPPVLSPPPHFAHPPHAPQPGACPAAAALVVRRQGRCCSRLVCILPPHLLISHSDWGLAVCRASAPATSTPPFTSFPGRVLFAAAKLAAPYHFPVAATTFPTTARPRVAFAAATLAPAAAVAAAPSASVATATASGRRTAGAQDGRASQEYASLTNPLIESRVSVTGGACEPTPHPHAPAGY
jgi:hypothetical protein